MGVETALDRRLDHHFNADVPHSLVHNGPMPLSAGSKAPDFTLRTPATEGFADVTLSENFGKKNTVLLFFPAAFSGVCTQEMCGVASGQFLKADEGTAVYGISVDQPYALNAWAKKENITTTLLSDLGGATSMAYGAVLENFAGTGGIAAARAAFVIDKEGNIRYAEQTPKPSDLPNFDAIKEALASL
jgi:peroxiredoxin